jgi:signal transduction histidine kinase/ligand-binding sensor domain-containing protein
MILFLRNVSFLVIAYTFLPACIYAQMQSFLPTIPPANTRQIHLQSDSPLQYSAIDVWTTENGLPHNAVLDLKQTRDGYIWFSSFNGAVRFDGKHFRLFRRSNTPLFKSNTVTTLWEEQRGGVWFGVQEGGVVRLGQDGIMTSLDSTYGFRDVMIRAWTEDRNESSPLRGTIYFSANKGVYAISPDTLKNVFAVRRDSIYNLDTPEVSQDILLDKRGGFWVGTRQGLYYRPSHDAKTKVQVFTTANGLPNISVECLYEDRSGTIWIGTRNGVCRFTNGVLVRDSALFSTTPVHDFVEDKNGNLWIGADNGLLLWTKSSAQPRIYRLSTEDGLSDNSIRSLIEDREGNIWIGTYYGGLNRLKRGLFSNIAPRDGLVNPIVYAALQARDASMWLATFGGVQHLTPTATTTYTTQNGLITPLTRCLAQDSTGNVWIGTYGALHRLSPEGRITAYSRRDGLVDDQIRALCAARDGTLWIGTVNGISTLKNGVFTTLTAKNGDIPSNGILGIIQDRAGNIWISSNGGGVIMLNPTSGAKTYLKPNRDVPSADAFQVTESPTSDDIWIPCNGGLVLWKNGVSTAFTVNDGLPDENVFHVMEDAQGMLWMTCNIGIFSVPKQALMRCASDRAKGITSKFTCTLFTRSDGLQTNSCTVPSFVCVTKTGEFWIPMLKGLAIINPAKRSRNEVAPPVYCETALADTISTTFTSVTRTITLAAGTEHLEITYTALCLSAPEQAKFRYMLEGVDKSWVSAETRRIAYYTNLAPGTYTFRVIACNNDGVWNETGDSVTVIMQAYFYQTWWFRGLCALALIAFGVGMVRLRTWRLHARAEILEKTVHERTRQIEEHSEEIEQQNVEIKRQMEILDAQAGDIELMNTTLNEQNIHLVEANTTLEQANREIHRQQHILESQAADIELANSELQERNSQLQALNQEKNEFLGIATHDLKNPLAAIRMTISLIQRYFERMTKDEVIERLGAIATSAERMTTIITNLLDINAIESGKFNITPSNIELVALTRAIVEEYRERATAKNLALHFTTPAESISAYADANVTMEVLDNLISNAVKYSPQGKNIYIRLNISNEAVAVEVQDEGPGLSDEDKKHLFGKFARLSARPTAGEHSTGLGLSIVKRMVEAMNGRVWCESELGKGAKFCVELPKAS